MTYGNKGSRKLIAIRAPWFDLDNYCHLDDTPETWFTQFALRIDLQRMRSLLAAPNSQVALRIRTVHGALAAILHEVGILSAKNVRFFLKNEEFLYPESFSTFHMLHSRGIYVRPVTLGDHMRVHDALKKTIRHQAQTEFSPWLSGQPPPPPSPRDRPSILSDPLGMHADLSLLNLPQAFISVDLRLPRALIKKQVAEVIEQLANQLDGLLVHANQTKLPTYAAWSKSKVLAYVDIRQWLDNLPDSTLRDGIQDADIADALEIDPKQLSDTTKKHAEDLTDPLSWAFMHLVEAAISSRRKPPTPSRKPKRTGGNRSKN